MTPIEATPIIEVAPVAMSLSVVIAVVGLLVVLVVFVFAAVRAINKLVTNQFALIRDTNEAIRKNTETLQKLDVTIKDRLLAYLETQVGKDRQS